MSSPSGQELAARLGITNPADYKVHCATWNGTIHPLDAFAQDPGERKKWNEHPIKRNEFNRKFVILFARYLPEREHWLFYGVFKVVSRPRQGGKIHYQVEETDQGKEFVGKLKIHFPLRALQRRVTCEKLLKDTTSLDVMDEPHSVEFNEVGNINITFGMLRNKFNPRDSAWAGPLGEVGGIYLVTDIGHNKRYVGVANDKGGGIWGRWGQYVDSGGTGYNKGLDELLSEMRERKRENYALHHLVFSVLESWELGTMTGEEGRQRESHWKRVMLSRDKRFGYNRN
ncbi:MAG: hypothetical protein MPK06_01840 [Alphaproteobacteria bacterium]|nr:hypothetical protein [Alphaproteobacteria bacterium]MDA8005270.1 hypothetical protein [Alphaproteobacteria bacterium]MDA8012689.1 hypothetical protein [Alphaproteobacteria bacterium]